MISGKLLFELGRLVRRLWFRPAVYSIVAVATVALAVVVPPFLPPEVKPPVTLEGKAVDTVLTVLASSMLAVVTFSLSALVAALAEATRSATPRATTLLMEDGAVQNTLSTFVGAFLFAVVGILGVSGSIYTEVGRFILFAATAVVITIVVVALVNWIERISRLGRVGETIDRVERATAEAFAAYAIDPGLGGVGPPLDAPEGPVVLAPRIGYVQHIDVPRIAEAAEAAGATVHLSVRPGAFVDPSRPIATISGGAGDGTIADCVRTAVTVGDQRSFSQDPRFGVVVLSEIAVRALSPGVNDPGTAIDVIGTIVRLMWQWQDAAAAAEPAPGTQLVSVPLLDPVDILEDAFRPVGRDGAGVVEVAARLARGLCSLAHAPDPALAGAARARLDDLLQRMRAAEAQPADLDSVQRVVARHLPAVPR
ncbi:MAG: DUF2254 domain-containing protein [Rhodospirillales bacterium]